MIPSGFWLKSKKQKYFIAIILLNLLLALIAPGHGRFHKWQHIFLLVCIYVS